jgi:hypothetical protein
MGPTFDIKVHREILQSNYTGIAHNERRCAAPSFGLCDRRNPYVHDQRIDQGQIIHFFGIIALHLQPILEGGKEGRASTVQEILIQIYFEVAAFQAGCEVGYERRNRSHFWKSLKFNVTEIRVWEDDCGWKSAKNDITELDAALGNSIT